MKKILLVGHCDFDNPRITALLKDNFKVNVVRVKLLKDTVLFLKQSKYDLVIINRIGAFDKESGIELIKLIKSDDNFDMPLMLVTNYPDSMKEAVSMGAVQGFGKEDLNNNPQSIIRLLKKYLN